MHDLLIEIVNSRVGHIGTFHAYLPQLDRLQCDMLCAAVGAIIEATPNNSLTGREPAAGEAYREAMVGNPNVRKQTTKENKMRPELKLGDKARDTISGFTGIIIAMTEWLNGCLRVTIAPTELKDGKRIESDTFDAEQIERVETAPPKVTTPTGGPSIHPTRARDPK